jgi:hypothetical protein
MTTSHPTLTFSRSRIDNFDQWVSLSSVISTVEIFLCAKFNNCQSQDNLKTYKISFIHDECR